jgi:hypothetical protein
MCALVATGKESPLQQLRVTSEHDYETELIPFEKIGQEVTENNTVVDSCLHQGPTQLDNVHANAAMCGLRAPSHEGKRIEVNQSEAERGGDEGGHGLLSRAGSSRNS